MRCGMTDLFLSVSLIRLNSCKNVQKTDEMTTFPRVIIEYALARFAYSLKMLFTDYIPSILFRALCWFLVLSQKAATKTQNSEHRTHASSFTNTHNCSSESCANIYVYAYVQAHILSLDCKMKSKMMNRQGEAAAERKK